MLDALLVILRYTSYALGTFLDVPIKLSGETSIRMYWIIVFLFLLPMFIRFMYVVMTKSINISNGGKK